MRPVFIYIVLISIICSCKPKQVIVSTPPPPVITAPAEDTIKVAKVPEVEVKADSFNVTLLLSLNGRRYFEKDTAGNYIYNEPDPASLAALQFYQGWKKAEAESPGYIKTSVIDAGIDSMDVLNLLKNDAMKQSDLVIAMLNPALNIPASRIAAERFPIVFTGHPSTTPLSANKKSWLALPSNRSQCMQMASFIKNNNTAGLYHILYRETSKNESELAGLFYDELISSGTDTAICKKINYNADDWNDLSGFLSPEKKNILFIPTSDESFVSSVLAKLSLSEDYEIIIAGLPTWENFSSVDPGLLERYHARIFSSTYLDYEDEKVKAFRKYFIEELFTDPLYSAFMGYDLYQWINTNRIHGNHIEKFESTTSLQSPATGYEFRSICEGCGFENQYISVLLYKEGGLEKQNK